MLVIDLIDYQLNNFPLLEASLMGVLEGLRNIGAKSGGTGQLDIYRFPERILPRRKKLRCETMCDLKKEQI